MCIVIALVQEAKAWLTPRGEGRPRDDEETIARQYAARVHSGRLRAAVRFATEREGGGPMQPDDIDSKTGRPVIDVLRSKHPPPHDTPIEALENFPDKPDPCPVVITSDAVERLSHKLRGGAGPSGVDATHLLRWLTHFDVESDKLRQEMADWTMWLANEHPPWAAYREIVASRLVALDKNPGVRPVGIGEIFRRLWGKLVLDSVGLEATEACGVRNLCAGLSAGIEGAVHAVNEEWAAAHPPPPGTPAPPAPDPAPDPGGESQEPPDSQPTTTLPPEEQDNQHVVVLLDADNGFNNLDRRSMMWAIRHLWPAAARFCFNLYRHWSALVVRGGDGQIIYSMEGVTQGCIISMIAYAIGVLRLYDESGEIAEANKRHPTINPLCTPGYADDFAISGNSDVVAKAVNRILEVGPKFGYSPNVGKSILIRDQSKPLPEALQQFQFAEDVGGHRYLGGFIGDKTCQDAWLKPKIAGWVKSVEALTKIALREPQAAYAGLTRSLQSKWVYLHRVMDGIQDQFAPIEEALRKFIDVLFAREATDEDRKLYSNGAKFCGMGILDPTEQGDHFDTSKSGGKYLIHALRHRAELDVEAHENSLKTARIVHVNQKELSYENRRDSVRGQATPEKRRCLDRMEHASAWLSIVPNKWAGTILSPLEFRDGINLRYGFLPRDIATHCACGAVNTRTHPQDCKIGGLVQARHNLLKREFQHLMSLAYGKASVSDEPPIYTGRKSKDERKKIEQRQVDPNRRGDILVRGFWQAGRECIFDVQVRDTDAPSVRNVEPKKLLAASEKQKKGKYLQACVDRNRNFTPLVYSVDGMPATEAKAAVKKLSADLAVKWHKEYSATCCLVRQRVGISLVRSASMCFRFTRNAPAQHNPIQFHGGGGLPLFQ